MSSAIRSSLSSLARRWSSFVEARAETEAARRFWDEGAPGEPENHYWGAQPLVRRAINRRVTGDPNCWPMEWFARRVRAGAAAAGLSVGCGPGSRARRDRRRGSAARSRASTSRREAIAQARRGRRGGEPEPRLSSTGSTTSTRSRCPPRRYDIVFFHGSLHHVRSVERGARAGAPSAQAGRAPLPRRVHGAGPLGVDGTPTGRLREAPSTRCPREFKNRRGADDPDSARRSARVDPLERDPPGDRAASSGSSRTARTAATSSGSSSPASTWRRCARTRRTSSRD